MKACSARHRWLAMVVLLFLSFGGVARGAEPGQVDVILWFDTEDYLLPADDDACLRLAEMLSQRQVRATFKVVGEKARVLEQRGRHDVIEALRKHDIGFHANYHSVHPTPSEYLADCNLLDGVAEFVRREGRGAADVRRIFGVDTLSCYGQPGSSWAPQAVAALGQIGVAPQGTPCYVDEGDHVGLNEQPFWYAGALHVYHMGQNWTRMELHNAAAVEPAKQKVSAIAERLRGRGGGLISIYYHPCEWVHQEFWDGVNFRRGANPPREQWKAPPQRPAAESEAAFERFGTYIDYILTIPGVHFVTASDLPALYPDTTRTAGATAEDLAELARRLTATGIKGPDIQVLGKSAYSAADQFELFASAVNAMLAGHSPQFPLKTTGLLGPDGPSPSGFKVDQVSRPAFRDAVRDVVDFIRAERRVPARVFVGADAVAPTDFLVGLAAAYIQGRTAGDTSKTDAVPLGQHLSLVPAEHVAEDSPGLFGGWVIHKEGFRAPHLLEVARWQAWTLKPAIHR